MRRWAAKRRKRSSEHGQLYIHMVQRRGGKMVRPRKVCLCGPVVRRFLLQMEREKRTIPPPICYGATSQATSFVSSRHCNKVVSSSKRLT
mmetsp:Transcript_63328/g.133558  ORF Transcript_63328/g.133558 Transcript_63328/m.133558 type:complete len:90 (-) Transcript_63328:1687-1956(-)